MSSSRSCQMGLKIRCSIDRSITGFPGIKLQKKSQQEYGAKRVYRNLRRRHVLMSAPQCAQRSLWVVYSFIRKCQIVLSVEIISILILVFSFVCIPFNMANIQCSDA